MQKEAHCRARRRIDEMKIQEVVWFVYCCAGCVLDESGGQRKKMRNRKSTQQWDIFFWCASNERSGCCEGRPLDEVGQVEVVVERGWMAVKQSSQISTISMQNRNLLLLKFKLQIELPRCKRPNDGGALLESLRKNIKKHLKANRLKERIRFELSSDGRPIPRNERLANL